MQVAVHAVLLAALAAGIVLGAGAGEPLFVISLSLGLLVSVLAAAQLRLGKEVVSVSSRQLVLETATWPWRYRRRFLRAFSTGTIAFDYEGREYRFGAKLAEDESRRVLELLAAA